MREEYYNIYENLHIDYALIFNIADRNTEKLLFGSSQEPPQRFYSQSLRIVREEIEINLKNFENPQFLRPDARHFLMVNLHQLVMLPIMKNIEQLGISSETVREMLNRDIHTILENARENSSDDEVSSHSIIDSVSKSWEDLELNSLQVWG